MVTVTNVTVRMYKPAVDQFRGWNGPIGHAVSRLADAVRWTQMVLVAKRSGALAVSIKVGPKTRWAGGITVTIGAGAGGGSAGRGRKGYALANDQGAAPHVIRPKRKNGMLVFYWAKVGRVVHLRRVNHPGNRGYYWAERGLVAAMARWSSGGWVFF
jgi:hypothetical protein